MKKPFRGEVKTPSRPGLGLGLGEHLRKHCISIFSTTENLTICVYLQSKNKRQQNKTKKKPISNVTEADFYTFTHKHTHACECAHAHTECMRRKAANISNLEVTQVHTCKTCIVKLLKFSEIKHFRL